MTFGNTIQSLTNGRAAKRANWAGYVKRTDMGGTGTAEGSYKLTFKNKGGTEYEYVYNGSTWTAPSTKVPFDADIMAAMIADDWTVGKATDFEAARSSSGTW